MVISRREAKAQSHPWPKLVLVHYLCGSAPPRENSTGMLISRRAAKAQSHLWPKLVLVLDLCVSASSRENAAGEDWCDLPHFFSGKVTLSPAFRLTRRFRRRMTSRRENES